jgi:hypothetical protein
MNRRQPFIPNAQAAKLMQPCDGAFNDPARRSKIAAMHSPALGDLVPDASTLQRLPMRLAVIRAVGLHTFWFFQWTTTCARNWGNAVDQWHELGDVMPVGLGQNDIDRDPLRVDEKVVFAPRLTAIGWVRSSFFPPWIARTDELSATTREKSSLSAPRSLASSTWCSRVQTPAFCQARSRRQHVMPEPQPISCGSISHGMPDCNTNRIPVSTRLSSRRLRPGWVLRRRLTGNSGWTISHSSSSTNSCAISPRHRKYQQGNLTNFLAFC